MQGNGKLKENLQFIQHKIQLIFSTEVYGSKLLVFYYKYTCFVQINPHVKCI